MYALPYLVLIKLHQLAINARRRDRTWRYVAWSTMAALCAVLMMVLGAAFCWLMWRLGVWWLTLVAGVLLVLPLVAAPVARHVLVPLGRVKLAYWAGVASRPGTDAPALGFCFAAWAWSCRPTPSAEAWLARRRDARRPLGDAEVVVTALLLAGRGDADGARKLMRSVAMIVEVHPSVRELVGEWLAADAAERGAWRELYDDAIAARWPATPLTYLLEGIAARRLEAAGAPGRYELVARWLLAPYRRATRTLLRVPVAAPARPPEPAAAPAELPALDHLPRAVAAHLDLTTRRASAPALADTVRAWDAALADAGTHAWLSRRALELDAPLGAVDRALRDIATAVTDELARAAEAAQLAAPAALLGAVGTPLARRLRHGRLDSLESAFTRWAGRRRAGERYPSIDEWREFVALQAAYEAACSAGGDELRRLAFPHAFSTGSNMAAWLWNEHKEYALSHAISRWLLDEARAVGDTEAIELGHRNCSLTIHTRLGKVLPD